MSQKEQLQQILQEYIPPASSGYIADLIVEHRIAFRVAKARKSKLGDYRSPFKGKGHRISVNHDLNKYQFLVTTIHEIAHLYTWNQYRNKVKSHGREWQNFYAQLMRPLLRTEVFPHDLIEVLEKRLHKPAASSCSDPELSLIFEQYNEDDGQQFVKDIPKGSTFILQGRFFEKGELARKRYKCLNLENKKYYMVHGLSRATLVDD